ncbi:hypothetical protein LTS18_013580, partial [Coniosporium uncinatum]
MSAPTPPPKNMFPLQDGESCSTTQSSLFARATPKQNVATAIPLTITPASAAPSNSSSRTSPTSIASALGTYMSHQTTPDVLKPAAISQTSLPLSTASSELAMPQSPPAPPSSIYAMSEAVAMSKSPGIMRRLSRGAHNRLTRARRSSTTHTDRDQSAGPVFMRRRSDSNRAVSEGAPDVSDLDLDFDEDTVTDCGNSLLDDPADNAFGIYTGRSSVASAPSGADAPRGSVILQQGTLLEKVTKKKRKTMTFRLDFDSGKIYWDPSKPSKKIYIDDIRDIHKGPVARHYREEATVPARFE